VLTWQRAALKQDIIIGIIGIDSGSPVTKSGCQLEKTKAEARKRMIVATIEKVKLYGCAGKAKA
jgi:hypothetical protein